MFAPEYTPLDDIVRKQKQQIMCVISLFFSFKLNKLFSK
jgi:hypothetical protein